MIIASRSKMLSWTNHAKAKMHFYKLSESRVRHVLNRPVRTEAGVAPKTIAVMAPASVKKNGKKEMWSQEIWVMIQDRDRTRTVISAWRYPGVTKVRSEATMHLMRQAYDEFVKDGKK
jgi:hypothetical protein